MDTLSIVVPCFNEEDTIIPFINAMMKIEEELQNKVLFEYIFINDGSTDKTLKVLKEQAKTKNNIKYLSFSRNFGKESALLAGLKNSTGEFVTVMDVDLQDPPELLPIMFNKIEEGYDVVGTYRKDREGEPPLRSFFSNMFYKVINKVSDTKMIAGARDYRLMTRQVVDSILELKEVNRFSKGLFSWVGYDTTYISFENRERVAGETSWNFWSLLKYSLEGFINFSEVLLNISTASGIISFISSVIGVIFIIVRKLTVGGSVNGWASIVVIFLFIGGIQLLCLGILGKYISKIFLETKKRPSYFIKESNL